MPRVRRRERRRRDIAYDDSHVLQLQSGLDLGGGFGRGDNADVAAMQVAWPILRSEVFLRQATHNRANAMGAAQLNENRDQAIRGGHDPNPRPAMPLGWWMFEATAEFNRKMWRDTPGQVAAMGLDMAQIFKDAGSDMYGEFRP